MIPRSLIMKKSHSLVGYLNLRLSSFMSFSLQANPSNLPLQKELEVDAERLPKENYMQPALQLYQKVLLRVVGEDP